ncbi:hypothetical protein ES705_28965 [subsurface metagenome]
MINGLYVVLINGVPQIKHKDAIDVSTPHALADLVAAVCSETEADTKVAAEATARTAAIATHAGLPNVHHSPFTSGTFTGDNASNRAIPHGLGVTPKMVLIAELSGVHLGFISGTKNVYVYGDADETVTVWNTTNFYVTKGTVFFNSSGIVYNWVAFP